MLEIVRDRPDAADVVQETLGEAWPAPGAYDRNGRVTWWRMSTERAGRPAPARGGWRRTVAVGAAAVVAVAALTGMYVAARYEARLGHMVRESIAARRQLERSEAALRAQVAAYAGVIDLLRDPATRVVDLRSPSVGSARSGPRPAAWGRVVWNDTRGGEAFFDHLAPAPAGQAYALWTYAGTAPRLAGLVRVDADGRATHRLEVTGGTATVTLFTVTLEPEGGAPAPTGPTVLRSK